MNCHGNEIANQIALKAQSQNMVAANNITLICFLFCSPNTNSPRCLHSIGRIGANCNGKSRDPTIIIPSHFPTVASQKAGGARTERHNRSLRLRLGIRALMEIVFSTLYC